MNRLSVLWIYLTIIQQMFHFIFSLQSIFGHNFDKFKDSLYCFGVLKSDLNILWKSFWFHSVIWSIDFYLPSWKKIPMIHWPNFCYIQLDARLKKRLFKTFALFLSLFYFRLWNISRPQQINLFHQNQKNFKKTLQ